MMYSIGGNVSGLAGSGLGLTFAAGANLSISSNGPFTFSEQLASGSSYAVAVATQPNTPAQTCMVASGTGTVTGPVTNIAVTCTTNTYTVGGSVAGLKGSSVTLQDNGGDNLVVLDGSSNFIFATPIASGQGYSVSLLSQPGNGEACSLDGDTGTVENANITDIRLICTATKGVSSASLIDAAFQAGTINLETALEYKMFALFLDPRLPAAYQGDDRDLTESTVVDDVYAQWASLSAAAQDILISFLTPPAYVGSWASPQSSSVSTASRVKSAKPRVVFCQQPQIDPHWFSVSGQHIRVWYDTRHTEDADTAQTLSDEMDNVIWPKLIGNVDGPMMKAPLSDGSLGGCNGVDEKLDVYLVEMTSIGQVSTVLGLTNSVSKWETKTYPVLIYLNRSLQPNSMKGSLAHEFAHASQWAYKVAANISDYPWLKEATAQAAIDLVYPNLPNDYCDNVRDFEQCWAHDYLDHPERSLNYVDGTDAGKRVPYGTYLFFQFLAHTSSPKVIAQVWASAESQSNELQAVDKAIDGGFQKQWPLFAKALWNQPPVDTSSFSTWDGLKLIPPLGTGSGNLALGGLASDTTLLDANLDPLSIRYYQFKVTDPYIRSFLVTNTLPSFGADSFHESTQVFYRKDGSSIWQWENWSLNVSTDVSRFYCLDIKDQRIVELAIVLSNDMPKDSKQFTDDSQPRVSYSNAGCWQYAGTFSETGSYVNGDVSSSSNLNVSAVLQVDASPTSVGQNVFDVLSGSLTLRQEAVEGCDLVSTASGDLAGNSASSAFLIDAGLSVPGGRGPSPTTVSGGAATTLTVHTVATCSSGNPPMESDSPQDIEWLVLPDTRLQALRADGSFSGTVTVPQSGTQLGSTQQWSFTPRRQQ